MFRFGLILLTIAALHGCGSSAEDPGDSASETSAAESSSSVNSELVALEAILDDAFEVFADASSWSVRMQVEMIGLKGPAVKMNGVLTGKGALRRAELEGELVGQTMEQLIVVDAEGNTWAQIKVQGRTVSVEKRRAGGGALAARFSDPMGIAPNWGPISGSADQLAILKRVYILSDGGSTNLREAEAHVIEAVLKDEFKQPRHAEMNKIDRVVMTLSKDGHLPLRFVSHAGSEGALTVDFTDFEFGVDLEDEQFAYKPPRGVRVARR